MKLEEINHSTVAEVDDQELLSLHRRVHQLWSLESNGEQEAAKSIAEVGIEKVLEDDPAHGREVIFALAAIENFESEDDSDVDIDEDV